MMRLMALIVVLSACSPVSDAKLSTSAIENLFTSLGTVTGQTVTCSGCFGYAGLSTAQLEIATNKGWSIA
jgi:uncharacterized protein YcgI (DUF1989 family)